MYPPSLPPPSDVHFDTPQSLNRRRSHEEEEECLLPPHTEEGCVTPSISGVGEHKTKYKEAIHPSPPLFPQTRPIHPPRHSRSIHPTHDSILCPPQVHAPLLAPQTHPPTHPSTQGRARKELRHGCLGGGDREGFKRRRRRRRRRKRRTPDPLSFPPRRQQQGA